MARDKRSGELVALKKLRMERERDGGGVLLLPFCSGSLLAARVASGAVRCRRVQPSTLPWSKSAWLLPPLRRRWRRLH